MTLEEQGERADEDGEIMTLCPKCRALNNIHSRQRIGVDHVEIACECGATYHYRGYGRPKDNRRRARRRRRRKPVRSKDHEDSSDR